MTKEEAVKKIRDFGLYHAIKDMPYSIKTIGAFKMAIEALEGPIWKSCNEPPETGKDVLICCATKNIYGKTRRYICVGYHVNRYEMESNVNWDEGCDEYREEDDTFYVLPGWYERIHNWDDYGSVFINDDVIGWMELPEFCEENKNESNN